jgi:hypothetical protein
MGCFTFDMLFAYPVQAFRYPRRHCPDLRVRSAHLSLDSRGILYANRKRKIRLRKGQP